MEALAPLLPWLWGFAGFLVLLWTIRGPLKFIYQALIKVHQFTEDWHGNGENHGVMKRLDDLETRSQQQSHTLAEMHHELKPNGGSSMNDRLTRVEKHLNPDAPDNH